jgi:hypothetical protein
MEVTVTDKRIHLTFSTTAGDLEDDFPANQSLHAVKHMVMGRLRLDPGQADQYVVTLNGTPLDEGKTLADLGLTDGAEMVIERRDVTKISSNG